MANIIKNQIIKHLSKFARNITADQISVQILSGKGELRNIELNEIVLSEALELPTWLRIKRALCNRIAVKIPWTKLKSQPVKLFIDEIRVEVELSSEEVFEHGSNPLSAFGDSTYGFANRVAEGMSLYVNSVEINFDSGVFRGSLALTKLAVESKSAGWQTVSDLRYTRLEDTKDNKLLLFKMVTWQLLRIEASTQSNSSGNVVAAPLRLITSNGKSRISVKKSTTDGRVLNGRIQILLDHILWIATLPQVRSAIAFYDHIMSIIKASPKKVPKIYHTQIVEIKIPAAKSNSSITIPNAFRHFDVQRTSYHVCVGRIDFHLCDDDQTINSHPVDWDIDCGALQVSLVRLSLDFYPSNIASSDRSNWIRYDNANDCASWVQKILQFHLCKLYNDFDPSAHSQIVELWPKLMSQNCVIRMHDIIVQCVTDMNSKKEAMFNLFMSDRKPNTSEADSPLFHLELASFYHPTCKSFPVPANVTHLLLGPFFFLIDQRTIRWLLFVINDIKYALQISKIMHEVSRMPKTYVRVDLLMPKVIIPLKEPFMRDKRFARRVVISMNTWSATNCKAVFGDESASFFKSISSNIIDFIDCIDMFVSKQHLKEFIFQLNQNSSADNGQGERIWISTSPIQINTDSGEGVWSTPLLASVAFHALISAEPMRVNVAVQPMSKIRVAINHFQFIQIMNLISNISDFVDQLVNDQKFFSAERSDGSCTTIELVCFLREIELNIILPNEQIPTPYDAQKPVQLPTTPSDDTIDELRSVYLTPDICAQQQTSARVTTSQYDEFFPEFSEEMDDESDSESDEAMSVATSIMDEELFALRPQHADIFGEEIAVGEEAFIDDVVPRRKKLSRELKKQVNVVSATLTDLSVVVSSLNHVSQGAGYIAKIAVEQHLNRVLADLYDEINNEESHSCTGNTAVDSDKATVKFQFYSVPDDRPPSLKIQIENFRVALDDIILRHLSAFVHDNEKTSVRLNLKIKLVDTQIIAIDPKSKSIRIKLNDCVIEHLKENNVMI